jgi:hypothetical protein
MNACFFPYIIKGTEYAPTKNGGCAGRILHRKQENWIFEKQFLMKFI